LKRTFPGVLYLHGLSPPIIHNLTPRKRWHEVPYCRHLAQRGYVVLIPDLRAFGESGGRFDWGKAEMTDIDNALDYLRSLKGVDHDRIAVMGNSWGGNLTLLFIERHPEITCAIDICGPIDYFQIYRNSKRSPFPTVRFIYIYMALTIGPPGKARQAWYERSPVNFLDKIQCPLLILNGEYDRRITLWNVTELDTRLKALGKEYTYIVYPDANHDLFDTENGQLERTERDTFRFLAKHLK
jgi:dipeptidyl aminopeptidase/acylaminoacyl peptidase